jgi:hypothetical protein
MAISLVNLLVKLGLDAGEFSKGLDDAEGKADSASKKITAGLSKPPWKPRWSKRS